MNRLFQKITLTVLLCTISANTIAMQPVIVPPAPAAAAPAASSWFGWIPAIVGLLWTGWEVKNTWQNNKTLRQKQTKINLNIEQLVRLKAVNRSAQYVEDLPKKLSLFKDTALDVTGVNGKIAAYNTLKCAEGDVTQIRESLDKEIDKALAEAQIQKKSVNTARWKNIVRPAFPIAATVLATSVQSSWKALASEQNIKDYSMACTMNPAIKNIFPTSGHYINNLRATMVGEAVVKQGVPIAGLYYSVRNSVNEELGPDHKAADYSWLSLAKKPVVVDAKQQKFNDWLKRYEKADLFHDTKNEYCPQAVAR